MTKEISFDIENDQYYCLVNATVHYGLERDSFDHAFGIERIEYLVPTSIEIESVYDIERSSYFVVIPHDLEVLATKIAFDKAR